MNDKVPFAALQKLLLELHFVDRSVPDSHRWFEHPASGTILVFRSYQPTDMVALADLRSARKMLDENGLIKPDQFDHLLYESSAA
jgi:hypothetical protein